MYNVAKVHYDNNTTPSLAIYSNKQEGNKSVTGKVALIKFMDVVISSIAVIKNIETLYMIHVLLCSQFEK